MSPKALNRCDLCGKWHAWYLVDDPQLGKLKVCQNCWELRYKLTGAADAAEKAPQQPVSLSSVKKKKLYPRR